MRARPPSFCPRRGYGESPARFVAGAGDGHWCGSGSRAHGFGRTAARYVVNEFSSLGTNLVIVLPAARKPVVSIPAMRSPARRVT